MNRKAKERSVYILYLCCLLIPWLGKDACGQTVSMSSNLNAFNSGFPTNHIYGTTVDHLGYLWIATPKGVLRYNGYESRVYDVTSGLPTEDIWNLVEDSSGRMWLLSKSDEIGYVRNNRYHPVLRFHPDKGLIYPVHAKHYRDGLVFVNKSGHNSKGLQWDLVHYNNKRLQVDVLPDVLGRDIQQILLDDYGDLISVSGNKYIHKLEKGQWRSLRNIPDDIANICRTRISDMRYFRVIESKMCFFLEGSADILVFDLYSKSPTRNVTPIREKDEKIVFVHNRKEDDLIILSSKRVYILDTNFKVQNTYDLSSLTHGDVISQKALYVFENHKLWGPALSTPDRGLYIGHKIPGNFGIYAGKSLTGFRFLCQLSDTTGCWWNETTKCMRVIGRNSSSTFNIPLLKNVSKAVCFNSSRIMVMADGHLYQFDPETWHLHRDYTQAANYGIIRDFVAVHKDSIFVMATGGFLGLFKGPQATNLINANYAHLAHDKIRNGLWLTGYQQIAFYDIKTNKQIILNAKKMGLRKGERTIVDNHYGNVFVKDVDRLFLLAEDRDSLIPIISSYRYNDAIVAIQNDRLVVAGRFGVLYMDIKGRGKLGAPVVYENTKDLYYNTVSDVQFSDNSIFMKTNKEVYQVTIPKEGVLPPAGKYFSVIASLPDTSFSVNTGDTLTLNDVSTTVYFDLINPLGRGKLRFFCKIHGAKTNSVELYGNSLSLSGLRPGHYYPVTVRISDDVWNAPPLLLKLYIQPRWWQRPFISLLALFLGLGLTLVTILVTRNIVLRKQAQKQLLLKMSLKGVYAQLNPHFIFNSLATTQYFIKTNKPKEASQHITRFSMLLRNFLNASRHKYNTIGEEKEHLINYIELQKARFTGMFNYRVDIAPEVDQRLKIPSLLLQPLVENAIQHGLFNKEDGHGTLLLYFYMEQKDLIITIDDDGIGRAAAAILKQEQLLKKESFGTALLNDLVYIFRKYEGLKIHFEYTDKVAPETGTIIRITVENIQR